MNSSPSSPAIPIESNQILLLEGFIKIRENKKWKSRWAIISKLSPIADCLQLLTYRNFKEKLKNYSSPKSILVLERYLGIESGFTLDKESNTLAIICSEQTIVLAFETREISSQWQTKLQEHFCRERHFLVHIVTVPTKSKLSCGPARLLLQDSYFCLVSGLAPRLNTHWWTIKQLRRYGIVDGRFCFEGGSHCGKGAGLHILYTSQPDELSRYFELASRDQLNHLDEVPKLESHRPYPKLNPKRLETQPSRSRTTNSSDSSTADSCSSIRLSDETCSSYYLNGEGSSVLNSELYHSSVTLMMPAAPPPEAPEKISGQRASSGFATISRFYTHSNSNCSKSSTATNTTNANGRSVKHSSTPPISVQHQRPTATINCTEQNGSDSDGNYPQATNPVENYDVPRNLCLNSGDPMINHHHHHHHHQTSNGGKATNNVPSGLEFCCCGCSFHHHHFENDNNSKRKNFKLNSASIPSSSFRIDGTVLLEPEEQKEFNGTSTNGYHAQCQKNAKISNDDSYRKINSEPNYQNMNFINSIEHYENMFFPRKIPDNSIGQQKMINNEKCPSTTTKEKLFDGQQEKEEKVMMENQQQEEPDNGSGRSLSTAAAGAVEEAITNGPTTVIATTTAAAVVVPKSEIHDDDGGSVRETPGGDCDFSLAAVAESEHDDGDRNEGNEKKSSLFSKKEKNHGNSYYGNGVEKKEHEKEEEPKVGDNGNDMVPGNPIDQSKCNDHHHHDGCCYHSTEIFFLDRKIKPNNGNDGNCSMTNLIITRSSAIPVSKIFCCSPSNYSPREKSHSFNDIPATNIHHFDHDHHDGWFNKFSKKPITTCRQSFGKRIQSDGFINNIKH